jgi:hypothetical protein
MFSKCDFKTVKLNDNNSYYGLIRYNEALILQNEFQKPFIREQTSKQIAKIGKRNYQLSDQFIISALNDYYKRMNQANKSEKETMLQNYNRLYNSWTILNQAKQQGQYKTMEDSYDEISYQLYLLGYKMSNN